MDDSDSLEQLVLTVRRRGQLLEIDPAFGLLGALRTARTGISSVSDQENSIEATLIPLFDITAPRQGTCAIRCLTGLAPVITELAARAGMVVNDDMAVSLLLPMADETWLPKFKFSDWAMINHVRTRDRGLFTIEPSQVHVEQMVRQIVVAWPDVKVLIIETERENAQYLANHLGQYICDVSVMSGRDSRQRPERVTVALPDALGLANIQTCDIIIVTDALPRCLEVPYEKNHPLLLVDFDDVYHPQLRKWSRSRWFDYAEAGWIPVGADPEQLAVERFLTSRPRKGGK